MITVELLGTKATIDGYNWLCDKPIIQKYLNASLPTFGPSGADPYPDLTQARLMAEKFGGKVLAYDEIEFVEGRVY